MDVRLQRLVLLLVACVPSPCAAEVLARLPLAQCTLQLEAEPRGLSLYLRLLPEGEDCPIDAAALRHVLRTGFARLPPERRGEYGSLFLGRLVNHPAWSRALEDAAAQRAPAQRDWSNQDVAELIDSSTPLQPLRALLDEFDYVLRAVSVEKVLVRVRPGDGARLPFDAQIWLRLAPKR